MAEPPEKLETSSRIGGKYLLQRKIASGGMGDIWAALNESTQSDVAIKVLRAEYALTKDLAARFRHEAHVASTLQHRNIVRVFDLLEEADGTLALVMELLRGESLAARIQRRGTLSHTEALGVLLPVLSALAHAHAHKIIHRDIKPENIILSLEPDGVIAPKLLDFGIAKTSNGSMNTELGLVLGTPRYMSPEQIRALPLDGRSDLFAITVICVELLTGKNPFASDVPSASLAAVLEVEVPYDDRIDPRLWAVLKRGLSKRPEERFENAVEYADALRAAMPEVQSMLDESLRGDGKDGGAKNAHYADISDFAEPVTDTGGRTLPPPLPRATNSSPPPAVSPRPSTPVPTFVLNSDSTSAIFARSTPPPAAASRKVAIAIALGTLAFTLFVGASLALRNSSTGTTSATSAESTAVAKLPPQADPLSTSTASAATTSTATATAAEPSASAAPLASAKADPPETVETAAQSTVTPPTTTATTTSTQTARTNTVVGPRPRTKPVATTPGF